MCGGSKPVQKAADPIPPPPTPPKLVSPEDESTAANASSTRASKSARAKLRIDLDPVASTAAGSTGLGIPS